MKQNLTRAQACKAIAATSTLAELHALTVRLFGAPVEPLGASAGLDNLIHKLAGKLPAVNGHVQRAYAEKQARLKVAEEKAQIAKCEAEAAEKAQIAKCEAEAAEKAKRSAAAKKAAETRKAKKLAEAQN